MLVRSVAFASILTVLLAGCSTSKTDSETAHGKPNTTLLCYCGVNMREPLEELAQTYESRAGVHIDLVTNDPRPLIDKIVVSPTADLFVCHDPFLPMLMNHGIKVTGAWVAASLTPTIAVAKGNPKNIHRLEEMARPGVRVGLTDVTSMSGNIVELMIKKAGITDAFRANVVKQFPAGRECATSLMRGEIDAGIVWNRVIFIFKDKLDGVEIDPKLRPQYGVDPAIDVKGLGHLELDYVRVTIAQLASSRYPDAARGFALLVASPEGQAAFERNGFSAPLPNRGALPSKR